VVEEGGEHLLRSCGSLILVQLGSPMLGVYSANGSGRRLVGMEGKSVLRPSMRCSSCRR